MKTIAIVQARMGSTRLPGKVLASIAGAPMLWHVVERTRKAKTLDAVLVATSEESEDHVVAEFCSKSSINCFRGVKADVLDRYYQAARQFDHATIVRVTADCPLIDSEVIDHVVETFRGGNYDYVSNIFPRSYPEGLDVEAFSSGALERAWREAFEPYDREHVTPYIREHSNLFQVGNVEHTENLSHLRWTVDYPEDMEFVRAVYDHMKMTDFGLAELLDLLRKFPELIKINLGVQRRRTR